jgi:hypothetical protein
MNMSSEILRLFAKNVRQPLQRINDRISDGDLTWQTAEIQAECETKLVHLGPNMKLWRHQLCDSITYWWFDYVMHFIFSLLFIYLL